MNINCDYSGKNIGKYKLEKKLGKGNFGAVYKATDQVLNSLKAIKILEISDPRKAYNLFTEAAIPYKCQHNNIVKINGGELIEFESELHFVVDMELVHGGSLEDKLCGEKFSVADSLICMKHILFGLQHSHAHGIIHRDIKPANILLDNKIPKLSDFGLATTLNSLIDPWIWYATHAAPETFINSTATVETDIYALGITLYRMVNCIDDWRNFIISFPNAQELQKSGKLIDKLPFESYIPQSVIRLIKKSCKKDPSKRYSSATDFRNAIEKLRIKYNWQQLDNWQWRGESLSEPPKTIFLESKRRSFDVIIKNRNRKSSCESQSFNIREEAEAYLLNYISNTTLY